MNQTVTQPQPMQPLMAQPQAAQPPAAQAGQYVVQPVGQSLPGQLPAPTQTVAQPSAQAPQTQAPAHHAGGHGHRATALPNIPGVTAGRQQWGVIFSVCAVFITLIGSFVLYFLSVSTQSQIKQVDAAIANLTEQVSNPPYSETNRQLQSINAALTGYRTATAAKTDYSQFLDKFPTVTPKGMTISNLLIDDKGAIRLSGRASSFVTAGQALLAYRQAPFLSDVNLTSVSLGSENDRAGVSVEFSMQLNKSGLAKAADPSAGANLAPTPSSSASPTDSTIPPTTSNDNL